MQSGKTKRKLIRRSRQIDLAILAMMPTISVDREEESVMDTLAGSTEMDMSSIDIERFILKLTYRESAILLLRGINTSIRDISKIMKISPSIIIEEMESMKKKAKIMYN